MSWLPKNSIYSSIDADTLPSTGLDEEAAAASRQIHAFRDEPGSPHLRASSSRRPARSIVGLLNPNGRHYHALGRDDVLEEDDEGAEDDHGPPRSLYASAFDTTGQPATHSPRKNSMFERSTARAPVANGLQERAMTPTTRGRRDLEAQQPVRDASARRSQSGSPSDSPPASLTHGSPTPSRADSSGPPTTPGLQLGGPGILQTAGIRFSRLHDLNRRERALWRWVNMDDLDFFLMEVYAYYMGKGVWCIALSRLCNLLTVGFVIAFSTFLVSCVDYSILRQQNSLEGVIVPRCVSTLHGGTLFVTLVFGGYWSWSAYQFGKAMNRLWGMHIFFEELLDVADADIQSTPWHVIVSRLTALRASHPSALSKVQGSEVVDAQRLDAHDVANRIMREENYLVALFNREILDLSVTLPGPLSGRTVGGQLTRLMEWNLRFCLIGFLFSPNGQVRRVFTSERNRAELVEALQHRLRLVGYANGVLAVPVWIYLVVYSFFRYFEEYRNTPATIGSRQFTQLARWKFREYNELPHIFADRLRLAQSPASAYMNHFPREKTTIVARFVAFVAGSFAAILILLSLLDPEAFLQFEITSGRTVIFYLGVCTAILAIARGMLPDSQNPAPGDAEQLMRSIAEHTHYLPEEWRGRLHAAEINVAFGQLYQMRIVNFVHEMLSVFVTPFVLAVTLPTCAPQIIDFFREFTVHVDGLGYVCSFAEFNFQRAGGPIPQPPVHQQQQQQQHQHQQQRQQGAPVRPPLPDGGPPSKMERSVLNFAQAHPDWRPEEGTTMLSTTAARARDYERAFARASSASRLRQTSAPSHARLAQSPARRKSALISEERGLGASYVEPLDLDDDQSPPSLDAKDDQSYFGLLTQAQNRW